ncbi:MAG: hypothetical protein LBH81_00050 [Rickettsiales bacterium]|jgi:hypothetical protein|nr:hypothetical protein [Rickettsiales bacterium]
MMKMTMPREDMERALYKMHNKRNLLLRAFLINYIAVFAVWLLSLTGFLEWAMKFFADWSAREMNNYMMFMFGAWKIAGVVLFLIPGLAAWWEMCSIEKRLGHR